MLTIIYAHPWEKSFNSAILKEVIDAATAKKLDFKVIDLNEQHFDPVMHKEELALFSKGECTDSMVKSYQEQLLKTDKIMFIFPVWWYNMPAILKGFCDKVMLKHFAYEPTSTGLKGLLTNIKSAVVITTAESPKWYLKWFAGNTIEKSFIKATLKGIGIKKSVWLHQGSINNVTDEKRKQFLASIKNYI